MKLTIVLLICFMPLTANAEIGNGGVFSLGLYGGSTMEATSNPTRSSLTSGSAELTFGRYTSERVSWHLALQSMTMQSPINEQEYSEYDGYRIGGRAMFHSNRLGLILGLGGGSLMKEFDDGRRVTVGHFSPEVGATFALYKGPSFQMDLTTLHYYMSTAGYDLVPASAWTQHYGLSLTFAPHVSDNGRSIVWIDGRAVHGLAQLISYTGKGAAFAARGLFSALR